MTKMHSTTGTLAIAAWLLAGCGDTDAIQQPALGTGSADFTRYVAIGNSLTAGVQGFGVEEKHQRLAFPAQLALQVGKTVYTRAAAMPDTAYEDFVIPGISAPGTQGNLKLVSLVPPQIVAIRPEEAGHTVNFTYPGRYNNLAVPGAKVAHLTTMDPSQPDPGDPVSLQNRFYLVLRGFGTVMEQTAALHPTFVTLWIGGSDVLGSILLGDPGDMTPAAEFETDFTAVVDLLTALEPRPGIVCADIPSLTILPFVTTVPPYVVNPVTLEPILNPVTGRPKPLEGPDGPLRTGANGGPADQVTLAAIDLIEQGFGFQLGAAIDLDFDGEPDIVGKGPLPGEVIVSVEEQTQIETRIGELNEIIRRVAGERGIPVVGVARRLDDAARNGVYLGGLEYTATYITGGLFSLDGVHPTDMGQAIVANAFLETINESFGASIPLVNYADLMGLSFGVDPVEGIRLGSTLNPWELPASFFRALREHPFVQGLRRSPS